MQNTLFTHSQSGFIIGNSCFGQWLSITNEIYKTFECNSKVFLKYFDKVWHKTYGLDGNLIKLLEDY